jgi:hypothetical protein
LHALDGFVAAVSRVRVHHMELGETVVRKVRRRGLGPVIALGNAYFRRAGAAFHMFPVLGDWQAWEARMYRALHDVDVTTIARGLEVPRFPGDDLGSLLRRGQPLRAPLRAAAEALRDLHDRGLSHGDANLGNFVFDGTVARPIDFDARHHAELPLAVRAADDLLALALDLFGRGAPVDAAISIIDAYRPSSEVRAALGRAAAPSGLSARTLLRARAHALAEEPLARALTALLNDRA